MSDIVLVINPTVVMFFAVSLMMRWVIVSVSTNDWGRGEEGLFGKLLDCVVPGFVMWIPIGIFVLVVDVVFDFDLLQHLP
ncbi:hypothetical protein BH24ACT15_BH24ACT15_05320 [soil metagenome]